MTETLVAVEPSENANDKAAAAAAIEVPVGREVDELEVARELVRQARDAGVALTRAGRSAQGDHQDGDRNRAQ
jgi:putative transposase